MHFAIGIEQAESNFSAYVPDLPGCTATGKTLNEVERAMREAIAFHLEGMREDGIISGGTSAGTRCLNTSGACIFPLRTPSKTEPGVPGNGTPR